MPNRKDDWPEDWDEWIGEALELERVPLETPEPEDVTPVAFRCYYDEIGQSSFSAGSRLAMWWLMASRLRAFELLHTSDLVCDIRASYVEWRVRVG